MKSVLFVCLGNICRSPMAEMIFKHLVDECGLGEEFYINSAGTSNENVVCGAGIYPNTKAILKKNNIPFAEHYAVQLTRVDYAIYDYIVCMEKSNISHVMRIIGSDPCGKVCRLLDFTDNPSDIGDPWYHRDFDRTFAEIYNGCKCMLEQLS